MGERGPDTEAGDWTELLRCPTTGLPLQLDESAAIMISRDGSTEYPVLEGVPVLVDFGKSVLPRPGSASGAVLERQVRRRKRPLDWLLRGSRFHDSAEGLSRMVDMLGGTGAEPARVLIIGAGSGSPGVAALVSDPRVEPIITDVQSGAGVSVVCDAHDLPFADASMDAVMSQWVLEHVVDPERVVSEIHRVLRPGGIVYSEVPFIQQVHFGRLDFVRWSPAGHRRLYRFFDEISMSVVAGPGMALSWSFVWFLKSFPSKEGLLSRWLGRIGRIVTLPFLLCDRWLVKRPGAWDAASGTAFTGRRREDPVSDTEVVASYRGLNDYYFRPDPD